MKLGLFTTYYIIATGFAKEEGQGAEEASELTKIGMNTLYGALGFLGLIVICIGVQFVHDAYKKCRRKKRRERRKQYLLA